MKLNRSYKMMMVVAVVAALAMTLIMPVATYASESGHRNTALALTGLSAYLLSNGRTGAGLLSAAGAAIAWDQADRDRYDGYGYFDRDRGRFDRDDNWNRDRDRDHNRDRDRNRHNRGDGDHDRDDHRGSGWNGGWNR